MGRKNVSVSLCVMIALVACVIPVSCTLGEDYQKTIEKKGMPFTQESFLKKVRAGNREHAELFIKAGMDINARDKDGSTALMVASERGTVQMAQLLIQNGADVNAKNIEGYTALMYVAFKGNLEIAELLIKNRADVNAKDKDGWTAVRFAAVQGKKELVALLNRAKNKK